ncbi:hypothetical protein KSB_95720 [Ktedonobacter robiniae]|uniref:Uncharacterized protein n=2 Tax=Ktedonobacter robiniae TaxID=2778365 RepID=A0ABQ3V8J5_9CHLR|nr:hypothetical protein KSB_95720 [Ktedonobacter robiniae]
MLRFGALCDDNHREYSPTSIVKDEIHADIIGRGRGADEQTAQSKPSLNQPTASELHQLSSLKLNNKTVIVVSLAMQSARVYTNGSLVRSFHIASSFTRLPTMPGHFQVDYTFEQGTLASDALPPGQGHIEVSYELFYRTGP